MSRKILIAAQSNKGALAYYCKLALETLHQKVEIFDPWDLPLMRKSYIGEFVKIWANKKLIDIVRIKKPDIVLTINGKEFYAKTIQKIERLGSVTACWWVDFPGIYTMWKSYVSIYDYWFYVSFDRSYFLKRGLKSAYYLPLGCWGTNVSTREKHKRDLCFVGTRYKNRDAIIEEILNEGLSLEIFGTGWEKSPLIVKEAFTKRIVYDEELIKAYNESKIGLNIHQDYGKGRSGVNMRTFEIPMSGCFQIVDFREELPELFKIDKEIVCFSNEKELVEKIQYYLDNEKEREAIAKAGRSRVEKDHTYLKRMEEMLSVIE